MASVHGFSQAHGTKLKKGVRLGAYKDPKALVAKVWGFWGMDFRIYKDSLSTLKPGLRRSYMFVARLLRGYFGGVGLGRSVSHVGFVSKGLGSRLMQYFLAKSAQKLPCKGICRCYKGL